MVAVQGLTREAIRVLIGRGLGPGAMELIVATSGGGTTSFLTDDLFGSGNEFANRYLLGTGPSNNDGTLTRITAASVSSSRTTLTTFPAWTSVDASDTGEVWMQKYSPRDIEALINEIIGGIHGIYYDPVEDITFHGGLNGDIARLTIPATFEMISDIQYRKVYDTIQVIGHGQVWDESVDSDFTVTRDSKDLLMGQVATKFVIGAGVGAGNLASDSITSLDISGMTHIEFPIKVVTTTVSDDLRIILSSTANGATETEAIVIPAITALTDTWVRVALTNPESDTAIISIALEYQANPGANTVWLGKIEATRADGDEWASIRRDKWRIDKEARQVVFFSPGGGKSTGAEDAGYSLLKIVGGDTPISLDADATVSEVPEDYIVNQAVAEALVRFGDQKDAQRAALFLGKGAVARADFPDPTYYRKVI